MKRFVLVLVIAVVALVGLFALWGYAPDGDPAALRARYAAPADRFVRLDRGLTVRVRDEGPRDAPAIMLLHGSTSSLEDWDAWAAGLRDRYRVIRYDQPGHGLTGPDPRDRYTMEDMARVVGRVADALHLDRFVLGGNSMGGEVAWTYATEHPERLSGLILVDAAGAPDNVPMSVPLGFKLMQSPVTAPLVRWITPRPLVASSVRDMFGDPGQVTPALVQRYRDMTLYPGNRAAALIRAKVKRTPATAQQMAAITVPTLLLWGGRDRLIPPRGAEWFKRALPNSSLVVIGEAGHLPMVEAPLRSLVAVRAFLDRDLGPGRTGTDASDATTRQDDGGPLMGSPEPVPAR